MDDSDIIGKKADDDEQHVPQAQQDVTGEENVEQTGPDTPSGGPAANEPTGAPSNAAHEEGRYLQDEAHGIDAPEKAGQRIDDEAQLTGPGPVNGDTEFGAFSVDGDGKLIDPGDLVDGTITVSDAFGAKWEIEPGERNAKDVIAELRERRAFREEQAAE